MIVDVARGPNETIGAGTESTHWLKTDRVGSEFGRTRCLPTCVLDPGALGCTTAPSVAKPGIPRPASVCR